MAVASARLGHRSAVITRTGADPFGRFVRTALRGYQVDDRFVTEVPGPPTPVTFCEIFPPDDFPIYPGAERAWLICDDPAHAWGAAAGRASQPTRDGRLAG